MSLLRAAYVSCVFAVLTLAAPAALATPDAPPTDAATTSKYAGWRASGGACNGGTDDEALAFSFIAGCTALARPRRPTAR